jgi:hypothetical protein
MTMPTININGTAQHVLVQKYTQARIAVQNALDSMYEASPHGRDYQTMARGAYSDAANEHAERIQSLRRIIREIETLELHCAGLLDEQL